MSWWQIFEHWVKAPYFSAWEKSSVSKDFGCFFFQHRNIRQARGTLICRIYTNSQSHASIFVSPANKFSALKNTHIYLHQKKLKRSQQWALRERYGDEGRQHKFKFWRKLPSTTTHQMQLFQWNASGFQHDQSSLNELSQEEMSIHDSINTDFCLYKYCRRRIVLVITNWKNFEVSRVFVKSVFSSQLKI